MLLYNKSLENEGTKPSDHSFNQLEGTGKDYLLKHPSTTEELEADSNESNMKKNKNKERRKRLAKKVK